MTTTTTTHTPEALAEAMCWRYALAAAGRQVREAGTLVNELRAIIHTAPEGTVPEVEGRLQAATIDLEAAAKVLHTIAAHQAGVLA